MLQWNTLIETTFPQQEIIPYAKSSSDSPTAAFHCTVNSFKINCLGGVILLFPCTLTKEGFYGVFNLKLDQLKMSTRYIRHNPYFLTCNMFITMFSKSWVTFCEYFYNLKKPKRKRKKTTEKGRDKKKKKNQEKKKKDNRKRQRQNNNNKKKKTKRKRKKTTEKGRDKKKKKTKRKRKKTTTEKGRDKKQKQKPKNPREKEKRQQKKAETKKNPNPPPPPPHTKYNNTQFSQSINIENDYSTVFIERAHSMKIFCPKPYKHTHTCILIHACTCSHTITSLLHTGKKNMIGNAWFVD